MDQVEKRDEAFFLGWVGVVYLGFRFSLARFRIRVSVSIRVRVRVSFFSLGSG